MAKRKGSRILGVKDSSEKKGVGTIFYIRYGSLNQDTLCNDSLTIWGTSMETK